MDRSLRNYFFKSLPSPKKGAADWLQKHPMDDVTWAAANPLPTEGDEVTCENTGKDDVVEMHINHGTIPDREKEALGTMVFVDPMAELVQEQGPEDVRGADQVPSINR